MIQPEKKLPFAIRKALRAASASFNRRLWWRAATEFAVGFAVIAGIVLASRFIPQATPYTLEVLAGAGVGLLLLLIIALVRVWRGHVPIHEIALYIDAHHPELQNRLISAYELSQQDNVNASQWMIDELQRETVDVIKSVSPASEFPASRLRQISAMGLMAVGVVLAGATGWQLFNTPIAVEDAVDEPEVAMAPAPFTVEPGDTRVRAGSSQVILVKQVEENAAVALRWRAENGLWQTASMPPSSAESVHFYQIDGIIDPLEYEVQVGQRRSDRFNIAVWTPPQVEGVNLTYNYPDYLGLEDKHVPSAGDISAVEGTEVTVEVEVNKPLAEAELVLKSGDRITLEKSSDLAWSGKLTVEEDGRYEIALADIEGDANDFSPNYRIQAIPDEAPEIKIDFPHGDSEATMLEEIPFSFNVSDDFGLRDFGLQYELVGEEPVRVELVETESGALQASADTMLMLEDIALNVGDFITWTIYAEDGKPDRGEFELLGDPFFLEIRPYDMRFSEAVSNQGGMGMQGQQAAADQKQVIIATYNLLRYAHEMDEDEFAQDKAVILEGQEQLLAEASQAVSGEEGQKLLEAMGESVRRLSGATLDNYGSELKSAIKEQNVAYRQILKMKPRESQIMQQEQQGGGGGGQNSPDISSLETKKRKNFYEESTTVEQQQEAAAEAQNKLRELAKRQAHINEQLAKLLTELQTATPEEQEEIRRQLQRLLEEQQRNMEQLDQLAGEVASGPMDREQAQQAQEDLDRARRQMERAERNMQQEDLQRARASGNKASGILDELEDQLGQLSGEAAAQRLAELQDQLRDLEQKSEELTERARDLQEKSESPSLDEVQETEKDAKAINEDRAELAQEFIDLLGEANETAIRSQASQEVMSEKLTDWIRDTERKGVVEDINEGAPWLEYGMYEPAIQNSEGIEKKLGEAADELGQVAEYLREDDLDGMQKALEELEQLIAEAEAKGREAQDGEQGQAGARPGEEGDERTQMAQAEQGPGQGFRPGEENPEGHQGAGQEPGDRQRPGEASPDGEMKGQQPGESDQQGNQPGQEPSKQEGQGEQQGEQQGEGQQPGSEGDPSEQQGNQPGQQPGQQEQEGQQGQQGQQPGQQQGQQGQQGQQPGEQQGQGQGQGGSQQQQQQTARGPQTLDGPPNNPGSVNSGGGRSGAHRGWTPWSEEALKEFLEQDYRDWIDRLRNAEAMLPDDSPFREDISRMIQDIDEMRRRYKRDWLRPQFDLFVEKAGKPLVETASELALVIEKILSEQEYAILDEGEVPAEYSDAVAEYFRNLAENGDSPAP